MDRKVVGENIVTSIINSYIVSDDFKRDAVHYVYKTIYNEINARIAGIGTSCTKDDGTFDLDKKDEFIDKMERETLKLEKMKEVFQDTFNYSPDWEDARDPVKEIFLPNEKRNNI